MNSKENSKEQVRNRMLKKAATLWGVPASEIDVSFDPIISILISACAAEIEKISSEIDESQTRITEKIIQLMTPETIFGARPSHAILQSAPIDHNITVKPEYLFSYKKKTTYKNTSENFKNIYFSPIQDFNLIHANLAYYATDDTIFENSGFKESKPTTGKQKNLPPSTIYLGINCDNENASFKDISFYFESQNIEDKTLFYHHLKNAEWYIGDKKIKVQNGFFNTEDDDQLKLDVIFNNTNNKTQNVIEQVRNNYSRHYITIKEDITFKSSFKELDHFINDNKIKTEGHIQWIKVVFPRVIDASILKNIYCSLNAFPVINRELNSITHQLKNYMNIVPIFSDSLFFDVKEISNTNGDIYKLQSKNNDNSDKGVFTIRTDNVGKLDHRKAKEYIKHLIELLKDESAAFTYFNNDFLHKNLNILNQLISLLENKVSEISKKVVETNYINVQPFQKKETLLIEYWTTNGDEGNNIKLGSPLRVYNGIGIRQKSSVLLTSSYGGKDDLTMNERLNAYRRSLLSRDRIVTKQDIKALCYEMYNDKVSNIEIKKGYMKDISLNKGLVHCILIELTANAKVKTDPNEWESLNNNLLLYLEKYSVSIFPYKINLIK